jgi:hypothetical protein
VKRLYALLAPAMMACASSGGTTASPATPASPPAEGTYEYLANLPNAQVRGTLQVLGDTALVSPVSDYCRPEPTRDPLYIRYTCQGTGAFESLFLRIDRRNPVQLSKWSATFRVQKRRDVCRRYEVRAGRQVCVETATETYETTESRSGNLQVRRPPS